MVTHETSAGDMYQVKWKDGGSLQWIAACGLWVITAIIITIIS